MRRRSSTNWRKSGAVVAAVLMLTVTGCGARLTKAQMDALNSSGANSNGVAGGADQSSNGVAIGPSTPSGSTPASGGSVPVAGSPGSSGGGATGQTGGAASNGAAGSSHSATGATGGGGGSSTVAAAGNPLAGPNGKMCASGAPGSGPGVTSSTVTVGNIATINGPVPGLFAGARYGAQAVADYIDSMGGLCGRKLVVNSADDQFDQATDQNEASTMANQVLSFMGSFSLQDSGIPAGAPGVPDIGEALTSQRFQSATNFSPQPNPPGFATGPFVYMKSLPQFAAASQHMALLVENTPQTAAEGKYLQDALQSVGFKFVFVDTTLQPTDPTFNGDVQKMKSAGVQGVEFEATGTIIGQLANAMYQAGMNIILGNYCAAAYDPAYIKNAGPGTEGTVLEQAVALYDGQDAASIPMVATFDQWYARVNPGAVPDIYATYSWLSGILLAQAINAEGSVSRTALDAGLKLETNFNGDGMAAPDNPVAKTPPSCWVLIDVKNNAFVRDPSTPSGFKCSPTGYYHEG